MNSHTSSSAIDAGAHQAATGHNALAEPTAAQRAAGNYKLGRIVVQGLRIAIENPRGTYREGVDADGTAWRCRMAAHYGYLSGTRGADGDGVDVFVGPAPESPRVWVINQVLGGQFDEHKVMLGFVDEAHARATYLSSYSPGWQGLGDIVPVSLDQLRWWLRWGDMARPLTPDQLPHAESESTPIMDRVTWTLDAQPHGMSLGKLLYNLRTDASGDPDLLMDAVTMDDLMQDPSIEQILMLDALVVEVGMMQRKMEQLNGLLLAAGQTVKPTGMEIGEPVRARGVLQIPVLFTMSDGQTLAVWFHNPDTTPAKLTPMDVLTSWKWQINKKDVTIVVAPERGADLQPRVVARRIMALIQKNSPAFQRANARTAEKASQIEALKGEVAGLESKLAGLNRELAIAKEEKLARAAAKPAKKSFTYAVKPVDGGFVIESNNGGGIVMAGRPNGPGILNTVPPRKFASESAARDYMAKKGMVEEAAAVAAPAAPAQAAQPADPAADVLDYLQYLARDMSGVENLLDMAARVDAAQSTYGTQDAQVRARQAGYAISWSYKTGRMPVEHAAWAKSVTDVDQCVKILAEVAMNGGGSVQSAVDAFGAIASRHAQAAPGLTDAQRQSISDEIVRTQNLLAKERQFSADMQKPVTPEADQDDLSTPDGRYMAGQRAFQRGVPEGNRPRLIGVGDWIRGYEDAKIASANAGEADPAADLFGDTGPAPLAPEGAESKVKTAKGTEVLTGYTVVEADRLITSHDPATGDANPSFPAELQPRDRGRDASIAWVRKTAQDLDPDLLGKSRRADSGAPIVGPDGVVESGNGRTMAVVLAYQTGKADDYRAWLESEASYFGLSPEKVKGMRRPVLVRVRTSQVDRAAFAVEANQDDKLAMTATEVAKADANRLTDDVVALMTEDGDLTAAANVPFLAAFLRTLGDAEAARYSTSDGKPTASLIARVQAAIFAKAYQDDRLLELTADVAKPEIANIVKALNHAAPEFIQAAALDPAAAGDATGKLTDAVEKSLNQQAVDALLGASNVIRQAKDAGQTVDEFVKQSGLFGDIDPDVAAMAVFISKNNRSAKRMGEAFKAMATFIKGELQRRQTADMFGDGEPVDFKDIVAAANRELERMYGPGVETIGLFDRPAVTEAPAPTNALEKRNVWIPNMTPAKLDRLLNKINRTPDDIEDLKDFKYFLLTDQQSAGEKGFYNNYKADGGSIGVLKNKFWLTNIDSAINEAQAAPKPFAEHKATDQESDFDPVAAVDAVYRFDAATDEFKAEVAKSLDDEDYSPFATARDIDTEVKKRGGTVSWALVAGAILDSAEGPDDEPDDGDEAGFGLLDGVLILDGDFKGHPFRGNQYGRGSSKSSNASRASREAKRAERKAGGHDRVMQYVHSSAAHAHKQAAKGAKGKTRAYHAKMAKFHAQRAAHHQDKIDGKMVLDSAALAAFEAEAWPDAALTVMDSAAGGDPQGVIRAGGKVLGRAVIGGDGKAMIYVGAKGKTRVTNPSGATAIWGEYPSVMVEGLFSGHEKRMAYEFENSLDKRPHKNLHRDLLSDRIAFHENQLADQDEKIAEMIAGGKGEFSSEVSGLKKARSKMAATLNKYKKEQSLRLGENSSLNAPQSAADPVTMTKETSPFDDASDEFKSYLSRTNVNATEGPFSSARQIEEMTRSYGGAVSWGMIGDVAQGVIRKDGQILGRAILANDGGAMIYTGAAGDQPVILGDGSPFDWNLPVPFGVTALFAAKKPAKAAAIQPATPTAEPAASTMTNDTPAAAPAPSIKKTIGSTNVGDFIPKIQLATMLKLERGEEGQFFRDKVKDLADQIASMPATYGQDGKGDQAVAHLHYFSGGADWYITEKDMDGGVDQAFGLADLGDGGELGYISIRELTALAGVELDLHWSPKTLGEIRGVAPTIAASPVHEPPSVPAADSAPDHKESSADAHQQMLDKMAAGYGYSGGASTLPDNFAKMARRVVRALLTADLHSLEEALHPSNPRTREAFSALFPRGTKLPKTVKGTREFLAGLVGEIKSSTGTDAPEKTGAGAAPPMPISHPSDPARAADLDFLRGIIAKTGDYTSDATLERLESLLAAYEGDAEVEALAAQAADVVQEAIVSQAQAVMAAG